MLEIRLSHRWTDSRLNTTGLARDSLELEPGALASFWSPDTYLKHAKLAATTELLQPAASLTVYGNKEILHAMVIMVSVDTGGRDDSDEGVDSIDSDDSVDSYDWGESVDSYDWDDWDGRDYSDESVDSNESDDSYDSYDWDGSDESDESADSNDWDECGQLRLGWQ